MEPPSETNAKDDNGVDRLDRQRRKHIEELSKDYGRISSMLVELDKQMQSFTRSIGDVVRSVPAHVGLTAMLDSYGESVAVGVKGTTAARETDDSGEDGDESATKKSRTDDATIVIHVPVDDEDKNDGIMGDEAEKDDPLVFL